MLDGSLPSLGWEVSQSRLVPLRTHFIFSFYITECHPTWWPELLFPLWSWEMTSPTWLGGCWDSTQSRATAAQRTSSLPDARRERSLGRMSSATISAWMSAGLGNDRGQGASEHHEEAIGSQSNIWLCLSDEITGDLPISMGGTMLDIYYKHSFVLAPFAKGLIQAWEQNVSLGTL